MGHRLPHASRAPFRFAVEAVKIVGECVQIRLRSRNPSAVCPACGRACRRFQSRYERRPARGSALAGALFFASGVAATVVARRTANLLAHKTFLLELRDRARLADLMDANSGLEPLARTNALTGIANRRWMMETLDRVGTEEFEQPEGTAILMCDVDHFSNSMTAWAMPKATAAL